MNTQSTAKNNDEFKAFKLKRPCKDCPFRNDLEPKLKGWLSEHRAKDIAHSTFFHGNNFPCHKTVTREYEQEFDYDSENGNEGYVWTEKESQCAGAAIMQIKTGNLSTWMQIATRMGWPDAEHLKELDLEAPVFETVEQFIEFHT